MLFTYDYSFSNPFEDDADAGAGNLSEREAKDLAEGIRLSKLSSGGRRAEASSSRRAKASHYLDGEDATQSDLDFIVADDEPYDASPSSPSSPADGSAVSDVDTPVRKSSSSAKGKAGKAKAKVVNKEVAEEKPVEERAAEEQEQEEQEEVEVAEEGVGEEAAADKEEVGDNKPAVFMEEYVFCSTLIHRTPLIHSLFLV
jgi:hypothetical protein